MLTSNEILKSLNITTEELLKDPEGKLELAIREGIREGIIASINETVPCSCSESIRTLLDQIK